MSHHNNVASSLIIMSKLQGWDPTEITGPAQAYPENKVQKGTRGGYSPNPGNGPATPKNQSQATDMRGTGSRRTTNANPFPGMPGNG